MEIFELLCLMLGMANGALMPFLPDPLAKERPIGTILLFSLTLGLLVLFLPIIVESPRFLSSLGLTLVCAAIAFFAANTSKTHAGQGQTQLESTKQPSRA